MVSRSILPAIYPPRKSGATKTLYVPGPGVLVSSFEAYGNPIVPPFTGTASLCVYAPGPGISSSSFDGARSAAPIEYAVVSGLVPASSGKYLGPGAFSSSTLSNLAPIVYAGIASSMLLIAYVVLYRFGPGKAADSGSFGTFGGGLPITARGAFGFGFCPLYLAGPGTPASLASRALGPIVYAGALPTLDGSPSGADVII